MGETEAMEFYALQHFIAAYNPSHSSHLRFVRLLQPGQQYPPEPDALCLLDEKELGVEVAHLLGSDFDAERLLAHKRRNPLTEEEKQANRCVSLRERVLNPHNTILAQKSEKHYRRSPGWLLIRNGFPLWTKQDFAQHMDEIIVPEVRPFQHVWLLGEHDGGLLQLR